MTCNLKLVLISLFAATTFLSCNSDSAHIEQRDDAYVWSHNDYWQDRPLHKALELGFQMIEADIHLVNGELYVKHDPPENLDETPLLEELYMKPLVEIIKNNNGVVLPGSNVDFYFVIDVKTEAGATFDKLMQVLEPYKQYFTRLENGEWIEGPIKLLISGNRPELSPDAPNRLAFIDGRLPDLGEGLLPELYPVISDRWGAYFTWDGTGEIPQEEYERLVSYVEQAHAEDKLIRFWAIQDNEHFWETLLSAGVDIINVDDLQMKRDFLDNRFSTATE